MITADMTIMEAMQVNENAAAILQGFGMHCFGCAVARGETVEQAAAAHGINLDELIAALNAA